MAEATRRRWAVHMHCSCGWQGNRAGVSIALNWKGGCGSKIHLETSLQVLTSVWWASRTLQRLPQAPGLVTCVNAKSSGQTPRENGEEKEMEEQATSPVVALLQGSQKPRWDSEAKGL